MTPTAKILQLFMQFFIGLPPPKALSGIDKPTTELGFPEEPDSEDTIVSIYMIQRRLLGTAGRGGWRDVALDRSIG
jgi:hypothetical protein